METKISSVRIKRIRDRCGFSRDLYVEPEGLAGGLALWWGANISVTVLYRSKNVIHVVLESTSLKVPAFVTFVYGPPKEGERRRVWDMLRGLVGGIHSSWLLVGDFNDVLSQGEKEGGTLDH
ncbi:hypothetical protein QN277_025533 [Acacia crassicarpa]|uniref:Endonuclease/exonuclease/phosphatase domain-containing protein n=1 Tax=Acacia crassicarpa TaxID=499986 RepID=A0AAE1MJP5_9FABA|nr:hypothetical protein QN277_025533 [Acacia crassicarpa]